MIIFHAELNLSIFVGTVFRYNLASSTYRFQSYNQAAFGSHSDGKLMEPYSSFIFISSTKRTSFKLWICEWISQTDDNLKNMFFSCNVDMMAVHQFIT